MTTIPQPSSLVHEKWNGEEEVDGDEEEIYIYIGHLHKTNKSRTKERDLSTVHTIERAKTKKTATTIHHLPARGQSPGRTHISGFGMWTFVDLERFVDHLFTCTFSTIHTGWNILVLVIRPPTISMSC